MKNGLIRIPETWTPDEALIVTNLLHGLLRAVHARYGPGLDHARRRHEDLADSCCDDDYLVDDLPF